MMNKRVIRLIAGVLAVGLLTVSFAAPAEAKTKKKSTAAVAAAQTNLAYTTYLPVSAAIDNGTEIICDIGNLRPLKAKIGNGLISVQGINYGNNYLATATNINGPALPYSKISTVGPAVRPYIEGAAASMGYSVGGCFDLEIGQFTNYAGYNCTNRLIQPMHYEVFVWPVAGFVPRMMVLLPDGSFRLLNDSEFDRNQSGLMFVDGTRLYTLHTYFPKAVYLLVYCPQ
jgi:hypothetical protein